MLFIKPIRSLLISINIYLRKAYLSPEFVFSPTFSWDGNYNVCLFLKLHLLKVFLVENCHLFFPLKIHFCSMKEKVENNEYDVAVLYKSVII